MNTYKISKDGRMLKSKHWKIEIREKRGHIHVTAKGPNFKRQGLTSVTDDLSKLERKVALLHFYRIARCGEDFKHCNYAEIFGSCFD